MSKVVKGTVLLTTLHAASLVGFAMELLAVSVTDIYCYDDFWLSLGKAPHQFPVFGGLMWGGLTVCGMQLAGKLGFGKRLTALSTGMFIVSMDILLDAVAIRLDGGFWTWVGRPVSTDIPLLVFWLALYAYCIAGTITLGIGKKHPWFLILAFMFVLATMCSCVAKPKGKS